MDDKELEEQQKQVEHDQASQKTAHVAGKAAATYFGGGAGGALYNAASNTEVGKRIEQTAGKALQQMPLLNGAMDTLDKSGALDAADKGLDLAGGGVSGNSLGGGGNSSSPSPGLPSLGGNDSNNNEQEGNASLDGSSILKVNNSKKIKIALIAGVGSFFLIIIIVLLSIASKLFPLYVAKEFVEGIWNNVVYFFTGGKDKEMSYYETLKEVQQEISNDYNICIDVNLITASLSVNRTFDDLMGDVDLDIEGDDVDSEGNQLDYKKMEKQVRLLANMQIITKVYSLDKEYKSGTGSYCKKSTEIVPIDANNTNLFDTGIFDSFSGLKPSDSSSFEKIAGNDRHSGAFAFFTKKVNEETNDAYYIYYPPFDSNDECTDKYAKDMIPDQQKEVSIGDFATRMNSVYYWNLVNSFIPEYYKDILPTDSELKEKKIREIADEIYLLYDQIGPSQTCSVAYSGPSSLCPNGITVEGVGTLDFEEYIAGVVSREAYVSEGMEALKAQAVAARTYALNYTNHCKNVIPNSTNAQTFTQNINDRARQAVSETNGEILVDKTGKIFSAQYDSFCYDDEDCPDAVKNADGSYTVTYTKSPDGEKHVITLSDPSQYGRILPGKGHAHGMSQLVSYQLAKEGKSYKEILSYFYSEGVEISLVLSPNNTDGATIIQGPITNYLDVASMNQYIYSQVSKAGIGTREGVVTAAVSLVSGIYNQTGYKLPYELKPSGKYSQYGIDPNWGTNTRNSSYPLNGLDCSGFISWAMHNGGYEYEVLSAKGWGNAGIKRQWYAGTTDDKAQPGDLIYNAPPRENGTTGHIRMIVGVNNDGYVVAEASSGKNGVRIKNISFTSTGSYYLVDMSNYYRDRSKVTDYPS